MNNATTANRNHKSLSNKKINRNRGTSKSPKKGALSKSRQNSLKEKESTVPEVKEQLSNVKVNARVSKLLSKLKRETPSDKPIQEEVTINVEKHTESNVLPIGRQIHEEICHTHPRQKRYTHLPLYDMK